ncbi:hypothetical protein KZC56_17495 [Microbacterium sp. SSW1-47]|uniref:hypothetical protein n=1 Tax=Microbacterium sufflavum TaxID=2851649 RepID=UPI001FFDD9E4|nr:hypothetical protein [Microbacterium sufflavum]MCK2028095.1 hypothetical protein [Microbacterium sufflavum]
MASTITHAAGSITPRVIEGYTATREARTVIHDILNQSNPDVTLRAAGPRRGSLKCVFPTETEAVAAFGVFSVPQVLLLTDAAVPSVGMSFVVAEGDLTVSLDPDTRVVWIVNVPFVEVTA